MSDGALYPGRSPASPVDSRVGGEPRPQAASSKLASEPESRRSAGARLLIVGWDGAQLSLIDRWVAEGRLPVMARLLREGVSAPLNSTIPPMTLPAWSTFLTGANPGRHGILDFTSRVPGTYRLRFANSTHRRVPTLFRVLSDRGRRVASIAVPTTFPPEALNGVMISGFDSPVATTIDPSFVTPRSLWPEIVEKFGGMAFADFQELHVGPGWHEAALDALLREIPRKEGIATWLMGRERWDALMVLFGETDTVSHHFWMHGDPDSPRHDPTVAPRLKDAIRTVYERCDAALGRLIDAARPDLVVVASDHGFGGAGDRVLYLNRFLEAHGWLTYASDAHAGGHRSGAGLVDAAKAAALRFLPPSAQQAVVRRLPSGVLDAIESRSRWGAIDFSRTRAWSDEMNYAATIHLNVRGRDPEGTIDDRDAAIADLGRLLTSWEIEGRPVVRRVHRREDVFRGDAAEGAPDLVLELDLPGGYSYTVLPSVRARRGETWRRLDPSEHAGGKGLGMNGSHRQHGTLVLSGRGIAGGRRVEADIADVLPTVFTALGEPIPDHVDGRVRQSAFERRLRPVWTRWQGSLADARELTAGDADALKRRLESLGYL